MRCRFLLATSHGRIDVTVEKRASRVAFLTSAFKRDLWIGAERERALLNSVQITFLAPELRAVRFDE